MSHRLKLRISTLLVLVHWVANSHIAKVWPLFPSASIFNCYANICGILCNFVFFWCFLCCHFSIDWFGTFGLIFCFYFYFSHSESVISKRCLEFPIYNRLANNLSHVCLKRWPLLPTFLLNMKGIPGVWGTYPSPQYEGHTWCVGYLY